MIGCAFAVDREYFFAVGAFDAAMNVWGGENVELSVRVWRCGGYLLKNPCSRVGHVFRSWTPYPLTNWDIARNNLRVAEVWMDEFKCLYMDRCDRTLLGCVNHTAGGFCIKIGLLRRLILC